MWTLVSTPVPDEDEDDSDQSLHPRSVDQVELLE
jgi:hypothetical protein